MNTLTSNVKVYQWQCFIDARRMRRVNKSAARSVAMLAVNTGGVHRQPVAQERDSYPNLEQPPLFRGTIGCHGSHPHILVNKTNCNAALT